MAAYTHYPLALAVALAVAAALLAARRPGGPIDVVVTAIAVASLSIPNYVFALLLVLVFSVGLGWFPAIGYARASEGLWAHVGSLTLPALSIALPLLGLYVRFLRGDLVAQLSGASYVVTARAKGLGPWSVLLRHALPSSLFGLLTIVAVNFGTVIGGTVVIEQVFALPGVGQLLLQAIHLRDVPVVQGVVLALALMTVLANLAADILYMVLDPRVRHAG